MVADTAAGCSPWCDALPREGMPVFVDVPGATLHVVAFGDGSRVLLAIGGWAGSWEMWLDVVTQLSASWRVIAFDHRGSGESPLGTDVSPAVLVDDVVAVLDHFGVERAVLAGESQGSLVALRVAADHPERVSGLALVAGTPLMPVLDDVTVAHVAAGLRSDTVATLQGICAIGLPEDVDGRYRRWAFDILRRSEPEASATLLTVLDGVDVTARLPGLDVPAVVVHGDADAIVPIENGRVLAQRLPDAELVVLPGVGHVPTLTRPLEVAAAIERLGDRVDARG